MSREPYFLSAAQRDRAIGALLGTAAGDALGADRTLYPPGVWTDNTAVAIATATGTAGAPRRPCAPPAPGAPRGTC